MISVSWESRSQRQKGTDKLFRQTAWIGDLFTIKTPNWLTMTIFKVKIDRFGDRRWWWMGSRVLIAKTEEERVVHSVTRFIRRRSRWIRCIGNSNPSIAPFFRLDISCWPRAVENEVYFLFEESEPIVLRRELALNQLLNPSYIQMVHPLSFSISMYKGMVDSGAHSLSRMVSRPGIGFSFSCMTSGPLQ